MEKIKTYAGQLLIVFAGALLALKAYEQLNKPKVAAPNTAPVAPAGTPAQ